MCTAIHMKHVNYFFKKNNKDIEVCPNLLNSMRVSDMK